VLWFAKGTWHDILADIRRAAGPPVALRRHRTCRDRAPRRPASAPLGFSHGCSLAARCRRFGADGESADRGGIPASRPAALARSLRCHGRRPADRMGATTARDTTTAA